MVLKQIAIDKQNKNEIFFPYLTQQTQVNSKLIIYLNIKPKIIELPE